jgi:hypothetical protein
VKFGNTTFSGVGAWTAGATGDNENSTSVSIISGGAEAGVIFSGNASQAGTLTASGTPLITQAAGHNNAFIIYGRVTIDLKGTTTEKSGQITLESGADPGLLAFYDDTSRILADTGDGVNVTLESLTIGGKNVSFPGSNMKVFKKSSSDAHLIRLEFGINPSKWGLISASETPNKNVEINSTAVVATSG